MNHRSTLWRRRCHSSKLLQVILILLFWGAGEFVVRATGLKIPGSVVGLFLVLALLATKWLKVGTLRRGANWYLAQMLLFFVPAVLAVLDHPEFLGLLGLKILLVIALGSLMVMLVTALVIDLCFRLTSREEVHAESVE
jgi:holin-like protein